MRRKLLLTIMMMVLSLNLMADNDVMITRDGEQREVKIDRISMDVVVFTDLKKKKMGKQTVPTSFVYLIKSDKRGNIFFDDQGNQSTQKKQKIGKKDEVMYLLEGKEQVVYDLQVQKETVTYKLADKKKAPVVTTPKSRIFMILHPDGTKDLYSGVVNPVVQQPQSQEEATVEQPVAAVEQPVQAAPLSVAQEQKAVDGGTSTAEDDGTGYATLSYFSFDGGSNYALGFGRMYMKGVGTEYNIRAEFKKYGNYSVDFIIDYAYPLYENGDVRIFALAGLGPSFRSQTVPEYKNGKLKDKDKFFVDMVGTVRAGVTVGKFVASVGYFLWAPKFKLGDERLDALQVSLGLSF